MARLRNLSGVEIPCIQGDVCDTHLLKAIFSKYDITAAMHFAGLKAVGESNLDPLLYYYNNVAGAISLLQVMQNCNVRSLVFSSSATIYGSPQYLPYDEHHLLAPINPYGRTKLMVEQMLQDLAASDSSWRIAALRYFNPVGAHESGLIGEAPSGIPNNLMPYLCQVAQGKMDVLKIFGADYPTPDGTGVRDYIHVMDLAEGHVAAFEYLAKYAGFEVFNLGTGRGVSVIELLNEFQAASGVKIKHEIVGRREGDLAEYYADATKAKTTFNWKATRSVAEMCSSAWRWQSNYENR